MPVSALRQSEPQTLNPKPYKVNKDSLIWRARVAGTHSRYKVSARADDTWYEWGFALQDFGFHFGGFILTTERLPRKQLRTLRALGQHMACFCSLEISDPQW